MKNVATFCCLLLLTLPCVYGQTTAEKVYQIFQDKCVSCHSHATPQSGLDLEGGSTALFGRIVEVHGNMVNVTPDNSAAATAGDAYITPGRPDRSYLFRKINQGLEHTLSLTEGEGEAMPPYGSPELTNVEKELIRQWILYGAKYTTDLVDEEQIISYYAGNGQASFPDGPPPAPEAGEGFQIKMGPFYLEPGGEVEYFQKYQLDLPADVDVNRLEIMMGTYSHHLILYDFEPGGDASINDGLRLNSFHNEIGLVAAVQEPTDLRLPGGTAFIWDQNLVLDLNSHYINYLPNLTYQAEVYINIYTQPAGTAAQEMHTDLLANFNIPIPNNGDLITHRQHLNYPAGEVFLWGIMGHTHQYGTGYKVYERLPGGVEGELIYDASCAQGIPGCVVPYFDYQHIPMRYFDPLYPLQMTFSRGLIHEASWINDGPQSVNFGPTSDDEMMVLILMYTTDTTGIVSDLREVGRPGHQVLAFPNPARDQVEFQLPGSLSIRQLGLYDGRGRLVRQQTGDGGNTLSLARNQLPAGLYFYRVEDDKGRLHTGRLVFE